MTAGSAAGRAGRAVIVAGRPDQDLLPQLRAACGDGARPVLCFDRGGWSGLFAHVIAAGFDLLTYRKAEAGKDIPAISDSEFTR